MLGQLTLDNTYNVLLTTRALLEKYHSCLLEFFDMDGKYTTGGTTGIKLICLSRMSFGVGSTLGGALGLGLSSRDQHLVQMGASYRIQYQGKAWDFVVPNTTAEGTVCLFTRTFGLSLPDFRCTINHLVFSIAVR